MASKAKRSTLQGSRERPPLAKGGGAAKAPAHTTCSTASSKRVKHKDSVTSTHSRDDSDSFQGDHAAGFSQSAAVSKLKRELAVSEKLCKIMNEKFFLSCRSSNGTTLLSRRSSQI